MADKVDWVKFNDFSGPRVRGKCRYRCPPNPSGFDVIVAATAEPEGGAFDTVVMYDGTAVTYGLLQWTFTSGRLHKLLHKTAPAMTSALGPIAYWYPFGEGLKKETGLRVNMSNGKLYLDTEEVEDFFSLRDICTPPNGKCPRTGSSWEKASRIALLFSELGENPVAQKVQLEFFANEIDVEQRLRRPKLGGKRIADFLYPEGRPENQYFVASRALFWAMWQNAPRKAEEDDAAVRKSPTKGKLVDAAVQDFLEGDPQDAVLEILSVVVPSKPRTKVLASMKGYDLGSPEGLEAMARGFAFSPYARWGVEKAANAKPAYTSRYEKVARTINEVMCETIVPEYWR